MRIRGFAKQNYTMLDNLKLGYGGTQEEMKRLLSDDAENLRDRGMIFHHLPILHRLFMQSKRKWT